MEIEFERLAVNDESEIQIDLQTVGDQKYPLLIADNLYQDPEYVRQVALTLETEPPQRNHPGKVAKLETNIDALHALVWKYVAKEFGYDQQQAVTRSSFGGYAFMRINRKKEDLTIHQCRPHADPVRIAGVVYLNLPEHCKGGTAFYRHRATGVEECLLPKKQNDPFEAQFMKIAQERGALNSYKKFRSEKFAMPYMEFIRSVLTTMPREKDYMTESNEDWELTNKADMKFNRLICYPGFLIHSGYYRDEWFGDTPEEQRLTQNVFIN